MIIEFEYEGAIYPYEVEDYDMQRYFVQNEIDAYVHDCKEKITEEQKKEFRKLLWWQAKNMDWEILNQYCESCSEDVEKFLYNKIYEEFNY